MGFFIRERSWIWVYWNSNYLLSLYNLHNKFKISQLTVLYKLLFFIFFEILCTHKLCTHNIIKHKNENMFCFTQRHNLPTIFVKIFRNCVYMFSVIVPTEINVFKFLILIFNRQAPKNKIDIWTNYSSADFSLFLWIKSVLVRGDPNKKILKKDEIVFCQKS